MRMEHNLKVAMEKFSAMIAESEEGNQRMCEEGNESMSEEGNERMWEEGNRCARRRERNESMCEQGRGLKVCVNKGGVESMREQGRG